MDEVNKHNFLALLNASMDEDNPMKAHLLVYAGRLLEGTSMPIRNSMIPSCRGQHGFICGPIRSRRIDHLRSQNWSAGCAAGA